MLVFTETLPATDQYFASVKAYTTTKGQTVIVKAVPRSASFPAAHSKAVLALLEKYNLNIPISYWHHEAYGNGYAWMSYTPSPCTCNCTGDCYDKE